MMNELQSQPLSDMVAVVTGASRGAGKGIALELGAAGATVYVTGRSVRGERNPHYDRFLSALGIDVPPGTVDETAEQVRALGGEGIPVRCDHTDERDVIRLFERVAADQGRLDLLVNNAWGGHEVPHEWGKTFWELSPGYWEAMFTGGVRNHWLASRHAVPLMLTRRRGLIATVSYWDEGRYIGNVFYDLAKASMNRLAFGMAQELRPHGVASVVVVPGWMRTEFVLAGANATEDTWQSVERLASTESPRYVGRAVAHLAGDANVLAKTGEVLYVADLAREYGFTDIDGRQVPRFEPTMPATD